VGDGAVVSAINGESTVVVSISAGESGNIVVTINGTSVVVASLGGIAQVLCEILGTSGVTCDLPLPLIADAATAVATVANIVSGIPVTAQNAGALTQIQTTLSSTAVVLQQVATGQPSAVTPYVAATVALFQSMLATQTALTLTTDRTAIYNLQVQAAMLYRSYRLLQQQNFTSSESNQFS
jgi:hypothetical protein